METRKSLWDNLKFFLILCVVIGHALDFFTAQSGSAKSVFLFIYTFHMPLFVFISGIFYNEKNIKKKVLFYISAGFTIKMLLSCTGSLLHGSRGFSLLSDGGVPWFMFALAAFTLLTYLLRQENLYYILAFSVVLACFVGFDKTISDYLYLSRTIIFYPFFLVGTMIDQDVWEKLRARHRLLVTLCSAAVLGVWLYCTFWRLDSFYWLRPLFTGRNPFGDDIPVYGPLARAMCYCITALVGASIILLMPAKKLPVISKMGARTSDVYVWHYPVLLVLNRYCDYGSLYAGKTGKILYVLVAVLMTLILSMGGPFQYPLKWIKGWIYHPRGTERLPEKTG